MHLKNKKCTSCICISVYICACNKLDYKKGCNTARQAPAFSPFALQAFFPWQLQYLWLNLYLYFSLCMFLYLCNTRKKSATLCWKFPLFCGSCTPSSRQLPPEVAVSLNLSALEQTNLCKNGKRQTICRTNRDLQEAEFWKRKLPKTATKLGKVGKVVGGSSEHIVITPGEWMSSIM